METINGNDIRLSDPHRHKFADALTEYVYDDTDRWVDHASGDAESPIGWFAQCGKRILRGDSQGFVWVERFGNDHEADMIVRALHYFDGVWDIEAWEDVSVEAFSAEHDEMIDRAWRYLSYCYSCDAESCDPHDWDMWRVHGEPHGPI